MRQIISLSLPQEETKELKKNAKQRGFSSVSAYVKYLFELDKDLILEKELLSSIKDSRKEYEKGTAFQAESLTELL